ncbi:MAG TPA: hypothetical protein PKO36_13980, partial [Candidatus Hydrogenedentes bacterium]|nr:hypothetical protein [Candidatus Hydrogenedentota bacterium]
MLEHGKPMVFGKDNDKGKRHQRTQPSILHSSCLKHGGILAIFGTAMQLQGKYPGKTQSAPSILYNFTILTHRRTATVCDNGSASSLLFFLSVVFLEHIRHGHCHARD